MTKVTRVKASSERTDTEEAIRELRAELRMCKSRCQAAHRAILAWEERCAALEAMLEATHWRKVEIDG